MNKLNREILRLSLPSIIANLTVPLVGMTDIAVAGHIDAGANGSAAFIGAISVGAMIFNLLYWNFGFLRAGTGGLAAQAFGRGDMRECGRIFVRGLGLALAISFATLMLQWPLAGLALLVCDASEQVESLALDYFYIRVWAAPATLSLMAFSGWFVGMQDSVSSMWKDLIVNGVNIGASLVLSLGLGGWEGLGFKGIALGTVIAQYCGLLFCSLVCVIKYRRRVFCHVSMQDIKGIVRGDDLHAFFKMNFNLFWRNVGFIAIYLGYTIIASGMGDTMLACSSIMMQLLMVFSYFTDGFAYAGEALAGRFIGACDGKMLTATVKYVFIWSMSIAVLFIGVYWLCGVPMLRIMTSDSSVVEACKAFLPWLLLMPVLGCAAFTWDGIYLGATASVAIRDAMLLSAAGFFAVWFALSGFAGLNHIKSQELALHILLGAYFVHLVIRAVYLTARYRKDIPLVGTERQS